MLFQNTKKLCHITEYCNLDLLVKILNFSCYYDATCSLMDDITLLQEWFLLFYGQTVTRTVIWSVWLLQNFIPITWTDKCVDKSTVNYPWNEQFMKLRVQSVTCCQPLDISASMLPLKQATTLPIPLKILV
jgi:hypothetical protein